VEIPEACKLSANSLYREDFSSVLEIQFLLLYYSVPDDIYPILWSGHFLVRLKGISAADERHLQTVNVW